MKVIILCGGQGTRIREAGELKPKPMLEVGSQPILWHILKTYAHHGNKDFVLACGYLGYQIKQFFLNYHAMVSDFTVSLGDKDSLQVHSDHPERDWKVTCADTGALTMTGGRVQRAAKYVPKGEPFMLTYGDGVGDVDITALLAFHKAHGKIGTITGVRPPGRFGELELTPAGLIKAFNEKPNVSEGHINGGFMVFEHAFVERYLSGREDEVLERDPLMRLAQDGELMMYRHEGFWQPMDTLREYQMLNDMWKSGKAPWKVWQD